MFEALEWLIKLDDESLAGRYETDECYDAIVFAKDVIARVKGKRDDVVD
jgi:hypothetical protein